MASYNKTILVGNITRDPELRYIGTNQTPVVDIGLAVNDRRRDPTGQWIEETTFVDVTAWGRTAEVIAEFCQKGSSILVEGRLKLDQWEVDGQKRSKLKVVCDNMQMLSGKGAKSEEGGEDAKPAKKPAKAKSVDVGGDDVPF